MKRLEKVLDKLEGYLLSIKRNTVEGKYELEVGIPKTWAYKSTEKVECKVLHKTDEGDIVKICALEEDVVIDDLIEFVNIIIDTNKRIAKMQEDFDKQLEKAKADLEDQVKSFYEKVDTLKESSFEEMEKKQRELGETPINKTKKEKEKEQILGFSKEEVEENDLQIKKELEEKLSK